MRVRLKDIAEITNLSVAAVSIILNNPESSRFNVKTRDRVLKVAKELNYIPNTAARALVKNESKLVGLIIPDLENPFFSSLAKFIELNLRNKGFTTLMVNSNESYENDINLIKFLIGRNADGLLIALSANSYGNEEPIGQLLSNIGTPYVLMDRVLDNYQCNHVIFNNKEGQYMATNHIIEMGHKKIGYISVKEGSLSGYYRYLGFKKSLREKGIEMDPKLVKSGSFNYITGYNNAEDLIKEGVTAIVCANDLIAFGVMKRAKELGIKIPGELSLIGYDNLIFNDMLDIGLSSIEQNTETLAKSSINLLLKHINDKSTLENIVLETSLIKRNSVEKL